MALSYHGFRDTNDCTNNTPAVFTHDDTVTAHPPANRDLENSLTPSPLQTPHRCREFDAFLKTSVHFLSRLITVSLISEDISLCPRW